MAWQERIRSTLGASDKRFAFHQSETEQAAGLLLDLVREQVPYEDVETGYRHYMSNNGYSQLETAAVLTEMQLRFGAWLS